jgi:hypothetical protein
MTLEDRLRKAGYLVDCSADGEGDLGKATTDPFDLTPPRLADALCVS